MKPIVLIGYPTGATLYAFPASQSLADWLLYRVPLVAGTGPDATRYSASVAPDSWVAFAGATPPASWAAALPRVLWNLANPPTLILTGYPPGETPYLFPANRSLTDWATFAVPMLAGTGPDADRYTATISRQVSDQWLAFAGAAPPADWSAAIADGQWDLAQTHQPLQITAGRSQTVPLEIHQTTAAQIPAYLADGTPVDWTGRTLSLAITDYRAALIDEITDASITRTSGSFTVTIGGESTAKRRTLRWRLLDVTGGNEIEILQGLFPVY